MGLGSANLVSSLRLVAARRSLFADNGYNLQRVIRAFGNVPRVFELSRIAGNEVLNVATLRPCGDNHHNTTQQPDITRLHAI
jgi:hypothetical protein